MTTTPTPATTRPCGICTQYRIIRGPRIRAEITGPMGLTGDVAEQRFERFMEGVHERHRARTRSAELVSAVAVAVWAGGTTEATA